MTRAVLLISLSLLLVVSIGVDACVWCDKELVNQFMSCTTDKLMNNARFSSISRESISDMKNSITAASNAITTSSRDSEVRMLNGAMAGEIVGLVKSHKTGQSSNELTGEIMDMIASCYTLVTGKQPAHFVQTLRKAVDFMLLDSGDDYDMPIAVASSSAQSGNNNPPNLNPPQNFPAGPPAKPLYQVNNLHPQAPEPQSIIRRQEPYPIIEPHPYSNQPQPSFNPAHPINNLRFFEPNQHPLFNYQPPRKLDYQPPRNFDHQPPRNLDHQPPRNLDHQPPRNLDHQPLRNFDQPPPPRNLDHQPPMNVHPQVFNEPQIFNQRPTPTNQIPMNNLFQRINPIPVFHQQRPNQPILFFNHQTPFVQPFKEVPLGFNHPPPNNEFKPIINNLPPQIHPNGKEPTQENKPVYQMNRPQGINFYPRERNLPPTFNKPILTFNNNVPRNNFEQPNIPNVGTFQGQPQQNGPSAFNQQIPAQSVSSSSAAISNTPIKANFNPASSNQLFRVNPIFSENRPKTLPLPNGPNENNNQPYQAPGASATSTAVGSSNNQPNQDANALASSKANSESTINNNNEQGNEPLNSTPKAESSSSTRPPNHGTRRPKIKNVDSKEACALRFSEALFVYMTNSTIFSEVLGPSTPKSFASMLIPEVNKRAAADSGYEGSEAEIEALSKIYVLPLPEGTSSAVYAEKISKAIMVPLFKMGKLENDCEVEAKSVGSNVLKYLELSLPLLNSIQSKPSQSSSSSADDASSSSISNNNAQAFAESSSNIQSDSYPDYKTDANANSNADAYIYDTNQSQDSTQQYSSTATPDENCDDDEQETTNTNFESGETNSEPIQSDDSPALLETDSDSQAPTQNTRPTFLIANPGQVPSSESSANAEADANALSSPDNSNTNSAPSSDQAPAQIAGTDSEKKHQNAQEILANSLINNPDANTKSQLDKLKAACIRSISNNGYNYHELTTTMLQISKGLKEMHPEWNGIKIHSMTYFQTIVACTQVLHNVATSLSIANSNSGNTAPVSRLNEFPINRFNEAPANRPPLKNEAPQKIIIQRDNFRERPAAFRPNNEQYFRRPFESPAVISNSASSFIVSNNAAPQQLERNRNFPGGFNNVNAYSAQNNFRQPAFEQPPAAQRQSFSSASASASASENNEFGGGARA